MTKHWRHEEAAASYLQVLTLRPDYVEAWLGRGNALTSLRKYDEAIAAYDKALELSSSLAAAWVGRGTALNECQRDVDALAAFDHALAKRPDFAEAWVGRGNALIHSRGLDEALACFDKAIELRPDLPAAWNGRGLALCQLGRYQDSVAALDRALTLDNQLVGAWINRGDVLKLLGLFDDGLASYQRALDLDPTLEQPLIGMAKLFWRAAMPMRPCVCSIASFQSCPTRRPSLARYSLWISWKHRFRPTSGRSGCMVADRRLERRADAERRRRSIASQADGSFSATSQPISGGIPPPIRLARSCVSMTRPDLRSSAMTTRQLATT